MDPVTNKILQGVPYAGMGSTLERNALIGVIRNLISQDRYNVDYILNYAESVGYQRQMAEDVFKELTGLSPKLIVNNNAYFDMPSYVPNMCIAWGISKSNKEKAFYIVPFEYGFAVMEKDEVNAPIPTVISATIPEAFDELKKVAKNIQTLDKIITKKLLETEEVPTDAQDVHQVNLPYAASPLQVLKKSFKDKVLSVSEFERQASKLLASEEITVDEAEDLMAWKQDLIDEDETYGNDVLELDEQWKPLNAEDDDNSFEEALLFVEETINNDNNNENESYPLAFEEAERLFGVDAEKLQEEYDRRHSSSKKASSNTINFDLGDTHIEVDDRTNGEVSEQDIKNAIEKENPQIWVNNTDGTHYIMDFSCNINGKKYNIGSTNIKGDYSLMQLWIERSPWDKKQSGIVPTKEIILDDGRKFTVRYNPNEKSITTILQGGKEVGVDMGTRLQILRKLFHKDDPTIVEEKSASKKVTAENITLDDIEVEDNKDQVQEEIEKIDETPAEDIFTETTPEQYFDKALQEDKVDTINDVVSKCIDKFSEKFKDFDKYQVKILSYNTKVLGDDKPVQEEMVEDKELNANAILQVILQITNNAEEANIKKVLAVFSITNGDLHWTGTVRGENDQVVAFTEEGLDALFEVNEPSEEELEDII